MTSPTVEFVRGNFLLAAVLFDAARAGGREFDERFDGLARALGGARFDEFAHEHQEGDEAGGLVARAHVVAERAGREGEQHGDGDQLVDAQAADAQILDGGDDDGINQNDRADERAGAGDGAAGFKQPVHDEGVEDEDDAENGLPEMHDGMLVVVAAAAIRPVLVFVMAQK